MEWSKDMTTRSIELFREKRVLWDPTVMDFKDRNKKHDAWTELGADMEMSANEVEKKMRMLIGQFQRELKKGKSGDGADAPYKSKWIFFKMLLFLKDKNEPRHSTEASFSPSNQDIVQSRDTNNSHLIIENDGQLLNELHLQVQDNTGSCQQKTVDKSIPLSLSHQAPSLQACKQASKQAKSTKRKADEMCEEVYTIIKQLSSNVKKRDEFDVFGEHVANTLRNLKSRSVQSYTKFEISSSLYRAEINDQRTSNSTPGSSIRSDTSTPILLDATPDAPNYSWSSEKK
ncbi:PREDICTED: uncharacterized protein LOC105561123 [Vollenhovia emeryi]|uniref:uncharacterized protein LOC105561123 n=1 Tax=Vollenhovia emeryi TaxID=411798 RepID=UPI0005F381DA|nr:PREDICTED: uncharacterized protein LOC105561123 [Vollenhovia emeryi]